MPGYPMSPTDPRRLLTLRRMLENQGIIQPTQEITPIVSPSVPANAQLGTEGPSTPPPSSMIDPATAVSQGFRIPGYTPPMAPPDYTGSAEQFMASAPNPQDITAGGAVPQAQTEGGSGDYMSKIGGPSPSNAPIPENQDTSNFSFFGKPEATDALTAFASGMLRGGNFREGLANAADGVNKVAKDYRGLTPREIALYTQKAQLQRKAAGAKFDTSNPMYDRNETMFIPGTDENGNPFFYNTKTRERALSADGLVRGPDAAFASRNRTLGTGTGKQIFAFTSGAQAAPAKIQQYDTILGGLNGAGVSTDVLTQSLGKLSEVTGISIGGINLQDRGVVKNQIAQMSVTAAQALQGQGQISDKERQLLADSLPKMDMNEDAARMVIGILKKAEERKIDQYRKWVAVRQADPNADFTSFLLDYGQGLNNGSDASSGSQSGNGSSVKQSLDQIFGN